MKIGVDTNEFPAAKRLDTWRGIMCDTYVGVDCSVQFDGFRSRIDGYLVGEHSITRALSSGHLVDRSSTLIKRDGLERVFFGLVLSGNTVMRQGDREVVLEPGMIAFNDSSRPFRTLLCANSDTIWLGVPKKPLLDRMNGLEDSTAIGFRPTRPINQIAVDLMAGLDDAIDEDLPPHEADALVVQVLDLLALTVMTSGLAPREDSHERLNVP